MKTAVVVSVASMCAVLVAIAIVLAVVLSKKKRKSGGTQAATNTLASQSAGASAFTGASGTASGTSYNIYSSDNTCAGCLNQWKVPKNFPVAIVAVHERDWDAYKYKTVRITYNGKSGDFVVGDYCADKDCGGCCSKNAAKYGKPRPFLLDMDSRAVTKIWGIKNPENTFSYPVHYTFGPTVDARTLWPKMGAKYGG